MAAIHRTKLFLKRHLPTPIYGALWLIPRYREYPAIISFLFGSTRHASFLQRLSLILRMIKIAVRVPCAHTCTEALSYILTILTLPNDVRGVVVEAGCFLGGSTAKLSLAAQLAGRELVVFDSFEGIPKNDEQHGTSIFGVKAEFLEGAYAGGLECVQHNVAAYGHVECCRFIRGWFDDTMPAFEEPVAVACLDVDLVSSTKTCLKNLYPLLVDGGTLYSQDGHLPLVLEVFEDDDFWREDLGADRPFVHGFGKSKLIKVVKRAEPISQLASAPT